MKVTDAYSLGQIKSLVAKMVPIYGPYATKDWILNHIEPGAVQAEAISVLLAYYAAHIA